MNKPQFVTGFALQNYQSAENGLYNAYQSHYDYWYIDGSLNTDIISEWSDKRLKEILKDANDKNVHPIFHSNFKVPICSDVEPLRLCAIEYIKNEIELCATLNCPIIIHAGAIVEPRVVTLAKNIALQNLIKSLASLKKYAEDRNVSIWLENLSYYPGYRPFHYIGTQPHEFEQILNEVDINLFFDCGHANVNTTIPVEQFFTQFHSHISGISISNNNGIVDQHLSIRSGSINFNNLFQCITNLNWQGIVGIEIRNQSPKSAITDITRSINENIHLTEQRC